MKPRIYQHRTHETSDRLVASIQPRPWGKPQAELLRHDFSHVDLFSHDPGSRSVPNTLQAKLTVGAANDVYEQDADRVTQQVMTLASPTPPKVQRQTAEDEIEDIQPKRLVETITPLVQRQEVLDNEEQVQTKCEACEQEEQVQRSSNSTEQAQPAF